MISASAFILIGGKSERFGSPKWRAEINGKTIVDRMWHACQNFEHRYLIGKDLPPDVDKPFIRDILELDAPINGLYTALNHTTTDWALLLSSDLPLIVEKIFIQLWAHIKPNRNIIIPMVHGELQPTCAFYNKKLKDKCYSLIQNNRMSLRDLVHAVKYHAVDLSDRADYFLNMNTKKDMRAAEKILSSKKRN